MQGRSPTRVAGGLLGAAVPRPGLRAPADVWQVVCRGSACSKGDGPRSGGIPASSAVRPGQGSESMEVPLCVRNGLQRRPFPADGSGGARRACWSDPASPDQAGRMSGASDRLGMSGGTDGRGASWPGSRPRLPGFLAPAPRAPFLLPGAAFMLDVRTNRDGFVVYDTDSDEPVMRFGTLRDADAFVAEALIADLHAKLQRWSLDHVPATW